MLNRVRLNGQPCLTPHCWEKFPIFTVNVLFLYMVLINSNVFAPNPFSSILGGVLCARLNQKPSQSQQSKQRHLFGCTCLSMKGINVAFLQDFVGLRKFNSLILIIKQNISPSLLLTCASVWLRLSPCLKMGVIGPDSRCRENILHSKHFVRYNVNHIVQSLTHDMWEKIYILWPQMNVLKKFLSH